MSAAQESMLRKAVVDTCRELSRLGLTFGKSGNVSVRCGDFFLVSPSGIPYDALTPADVALMAFNDRWAGPKRPSSEWRFHRDILKNRRDVNAIVHTHSLNATALACTGRGIPAFHYMVAVAGGADIRCAPYATFGTQALSEHAVTALLDRKACLLANHGVIATGADLASALSLAGEVENLAAQYLAALVIGEPRVLDQAEMVRVLERFRTYGRQGTDDDAELVHAGSALS